MSDLFVANEAKAYLIAQGLAQDINAAPSLTVPAILINPADGAAEPRGTEKNPRTENSTISLYETIAATINGPDMQDTFLDVIVRSRSGLTVKLIHRRINELFVNPNDAVGHKRQWMLHNLLVEYSHEWRPEQEIAATEISFGRMASYRFGCRRKALLGLPYTP